MGGRPAVTGNDRWDWELTDSARRQFDALTPGARERLVGKLDEVVGDPWRDPVEYLESLSGMPHRKLRIGPFRLGCRLDRETNTFWVLRIRKRGGDAYRGDD